MTSRFIGSPGSVWIVTTAFVLTAAGSAPPVVRAATPRLAVELLDLNQFSGAVRTQAISINRELVGLRDVLPAQIEVEASRRPTDDYDFAITDPVLRVQGGDLSLTVHYRGPDAVEDWPTAWYRESCTAAKEAREECFRATDEERAAAVVADLLNQTLVHWRNGIFRPFAVRSCERQSLLLVRLTLSPPSIDSAYREPASWFDYRPSVWHAASGDPYPERLGLVLGRRTKEGETFVFERRFDPDRSFEALCETEGGWILEHQYPGSYRYLPSHVPPVAPVAINAAPASVWEEP